MAEVAKVAEKGMVYFWASAARRESREHERMY